MIINIVAVGKLQQDFLKIFNSYKKKIQFYSKLNIIEVKEINEQNPKIQIKKETQSILNVIPKNSKIFLCSLKGKSYTSKKFVDILENNNLTFIIGGSYGVDESKFNNKITFSEMTFPHQLFRIILIEQIFRSFSIKNGSKYNK